MSRSLRVTATMTSLLRGGGVLVRIVTVTMAICVSVVGLSAAADVEAAVATLRELVAAGPVAGRVMSS